MTDREIDVSSRFRLRIEYNNMERRKIVRDRQASFGCFEGGRSQQRLRRARLLAGAVALAVLSVVPASAQERTVTDFRGEVAVPAEPERIAVLNLPALGDPLLTLGHAFIGAPGADQPQNFGYLPEGALDGVINLGTPREIDLEALAAADPDLIIATDQNGPILDLLDAIATTYVVDTTAMATDRWTIVEQLAEALGEEETLAAYRAEYDARTSALRPRFEGSTVSFVRLVPDALLTYHGNSPIGALLSDIGLDVTSALEGVGEATGGPNYIVSLSPEQVGALTGDYLIVYTENLSREEAEAVIGGALWQTIPAVAAGDVALVVKSETDFLLLPWGRYGTMHDLDVIEEALAPLVAG